MHSTPRGQNSPLYVHKTRSQLLSSGFLYFKTKGGDVGGERRYEGVVREMRERRGAEGGGVLRAFVDWNCLKQAGIALMREAKRRRTRRSSAWEREWIRLEDLCVCCIYVMRRENFLIDPTSKRPIYYIYMHT
jgi:hypothetical protein